MQARQYENDLKRVRDDHRIAVREINLLKDELARLRVREVTYNSFKKIRSKLSLHSLYYALRVATLRSPLPCHCTLMTQLLSKRCRSGGKPLAAL